MEKLETKIDCANRSYVGVSTTDKDKDGTMITIKELANKTDKDETCFLVNFERDYNGDGVRKIVREVVIRESSLHLLKDAIDVLIQERAKSKEPEPCDPEYCLAC